MLLQEKTLIRNATVADLPAIVNIYNSTIPSRRVTGDIQPVTVESRRGWFEAHSAQAYPIWVAQQGNSIAGWFSFQPFYGRPAYQKTAEISIYVAPDYRRQGIGSRLLKQAIAEGPALKFVTLLGFVFAQNEPSLQLLERFGFREWGFLPSVAEFDTGTRDLVIMGCKLAPR
ncbi:MAG: GNAT family N-acetyltransferase [Elainellaceae cyanobacterium]